MDTGRLRRVVETVAREAGWGRTLPKGRGLGIAAHYSFVSYVATVVEVAVDDAGVITMPAHRHRGGLRRDASTRTGCARRCRAPR